MMWFTRNKTHQIVLAKLEYERERTRRQAGNILRYRDIVDKNADDLIEVLNELEKLIKHCRVAPVSTIRVLRKHGR